MVAVHWTPKVVRTGGLPETFGGLLPLPQPATLFQWNGPCPVPPFMVYYLYRQQTSFVG